MAVRFKSGCRTGEVLDETELNGCLAPDYSIAETFLAHLGPHISYFVYFYIAGPPLSTI